MARRSKNEVRGQETFSFEKPHIDFVDPIAFAESSKIAANRRKNRKGDFKLSNRTSKFNSKVKNLWVAKSSEEIKAVSLDPEVYINQSRISARRRVIDRYNDDPKVSTTQARLWGNFAAGFVRPEALKKFNSYAYNSAILGGKLFSILPKGLDFSGEYSGEMIRESDQAKEGVANYIVDLSSFSGSNVEDYEKREWIYEHWTNRREQALDWAKTEVIDVITNKVLEDFYEEAYYSEYNRRYYWENTIEQIDAVKKASNARPPVYEQVPIECYERDIVNY